MSNSAPLVDPRDAAALRGEVTDNLRANGINIVEADQASAALVSIVSRFGEIVIERLNQAPDKTFLAFLDLLGTSPLPPEPARVPLTFTVATGSATDAVVPAGTQVAAAAAEGERAPVVFETERELTAVAAGVQALIAVDAERDLVADHSALLAAPVPDGVHVFAGNRPNEHLLYVGHNALLSNALLETLEFHFHVSDDSPDAPDLRTIQWEAWDGVHGVPLLATRKEQVVGGRRRSDTTQSLRKTGILTFGDLTEVPEQVVNGIRSRWLRGRLLTPVSSGSRPAQGMVRAAQLPLLDGVHVSAKFGRATLVPDVAFTNAQSVDVSKPFHPFGEKPRIGDVFYLGHREALGQPNGAVTVDVALLNPRVPAAGGSGSIPATTPSADLKLKWEAWNGSAWALLGTTTPNGAASSVLVDNSKAFSASSAVTFPLPPTLAPTTVNGVESHWIRVQIASGNYGVEADYVVDATQPGGFRLVLATFKPPVVSALSLSYQVSTPVVAADAVVAFNNGQYQELTSALVAGRAAPFVSLPPEPPALYAAFTLPPARRSFPNRTVSLYHGVRLPPYGEHPTPLSPELSVEGATAGSTVLHRFTFSNASGELLHGDLSAVGGAWASAVTPASVTLLPGVSTQIDVSVTVPAVAQLSGINAGDRGFLMLRTTTAVAAANAATNAAANAVASTAVTAADTTTATATDHSANVTIHSAAFETRVGAVAPRRREVRFEYWNGRAWAKLVATDGTDLFTRPGLVEFLGPADFAVSTQFGVTGFWMRALFEPGDGPSAQLRTLLLNTTFASQTVTLRNEILGSSDATADQRFRTTRSPVLANPSLDVREAEGWVPWAQVADFHGSFAVDRHFVLDHLAGDVRFGDGVQGRIPPRGIGNVRMARYQTGGGAAGNRAAGTIAQLNTTVPYIDKVSNLEAATGGAAAESRAALLTRAPRALRHGGRAVAIEDYEDLAKTASSAVARSKAVPLRQLGDDPLSKTLAPGAVSIVIVPWAAIAKPVPSVGLLTEVEDYLTSCATPTATIDVVGPLYVRVDVSIEIALLSLERASEVEDAVRNALRAFLHPLTGGRDGTGWDFGRQPHLSDLHAVASGVAGVDHIRQLSMQQVEEPTGALATGRFLVYSGLHQITLTFLGAE